MFPTVFQLPVLSGSSPLVSYQGRTEFTLACREDYEFALKVPGKHTILNSAAALAMVTGLECFKGKMPDREQWDLIDEGFRAFAGSRRRSEILGEREGILYMDDYAHHPTAVKTTLKGYRQFYPDRRLVVDFMSHTYSRTEGLFEEFCRAFSDADLLVLHKIYGSAREAAGKVSGRDLYRGILEHETAGPRGKDVKDRIFYYYEPEDAREFLKKELKSGDIFLTMGAGNNWTLGRSLYEDGGKE